MLPTFAGAETVRWARASDPATLDPHAVNLNTNVTLLHQVYEPLVLRTADGKLQPGRNIRSTSRRSFRIERPSNIDVEVNGVVTRRLKLDL